MKNKGSQFEAEITTMIKQRFYDIQSIRHDVFVALIALIISISFSISIANHLSPLFWERRVIVQITFLLLAIFFQSIVYIQVFKRMISPGSSFINRIERIFWVFLPTLLGLLFITSTDFSMPKLNPNNTLEIFASNNSPDKTTKVSILEIRDTEGKKVPFRKIERQGWELKNNTLTANEGSASLKYRFKGNLGNSIAILFFSGPSSGPVTIRLNGDQVPVEFPKAGYSNHWKIIQVQASPLISPQHMQAIVLDFADLLSISFILSILATFWLKKIETNSKERIYVVLIFLGFCYLSIYYLNNLLPLIDTVAWQFRFPPILPPYDPVGVDFRGGVYIPARELFLNGNLNIYSNPNYYNIYPPLSNVIYAPYLLWNENDAYLVHIFVLLVVNVFCLSLVAIIAKQYFFPDSGSNNMLANAALFVIFMGVLFSLLTSYPFLFSVERGNIDIFAMAFSLASIWTLLKSPNRIWYQVLLLSIAVHMKIYPIFLFALLFYKHRFKIVLPSLIVNIGFLLILGPANAIAFIKSIQDFGNQVPVSVLSHSAYAFASILAQSNPQFSGYLPIMRPIFTFLPLVIWVIAAIMLAQHESSEKNIILGFMITIPLMEVFPYLSNDYKLVISSSAIFLLTALIVFRQWTYRNLMDYIQLFVVLIIMLFIGRSYAFIDSSLPIIQNKYIWEVLLQIMMLINIFQQLRLDRKLIESSSIQVESATERL